MSINPLPPQAYTKDTLAKAYQWLQGQPDEVKSMAKSSDLLVGLFLKANRDGAQVLQGKSFQSFRAELKNLAEMVEDFVPPAAHPSPSQQVAQHGAAAPQATKAPQPPQPPPTPQPSSQVAPPSSRPPQKMSKEEVTERDNKVDSKMDSEVLFAQLDSKTLQFLELVQKQLNLSSPMEALRMLVSLGFERVKSLF